MPWFDAISLIVALYLLYFTIGALVKFKKPFAFRITNSFLLLLSIYFILYTTLLSRSPNEYPTVLMPFYSFFVAKSQPEMWRQMYMNVVLFMPFGMFLANVFGEKVKKSIIMTIVTSSGFLMSLLIEATQHFCRLGEAWTDDVICNAFGAFCGATVVFAIERFTNKHIKRTNI